MRVYFYNLEGINRSTGNCYWIIWDSLQKLVSHLRIIQPYDQLKTDNSRPSQLKPQVVQKKRTLLFLRAILMGQTSSLAFPSPHHRTKIDNNTGQGIVREFWGKSRILPAQDGLPKCNTPTHESTNNNGCVLGTNWGETASALRRRGADEKKKSA